MSEQKQTSETPVIGEKFYVAKRDELLNEIQDIDAELVLQFGKRKSGSSPRMWFSDWPDTFNNNGTWYKTWGKGGDRVINAPVDVNQYSLGYLIRNVFRKIKVSIFGE